MKTIRSAVGMGKLKATLRGLSLPVWLLLLLGRVEATTITIALDDSWNGWRYSLAVYAGDTVVWVNPNPGWPTNYVESYGGEWKSGPLRPGDKFSFTFTNPGFYAYRTVDPSKAGTVTVLAWTGAPPAVTINTPVDGATVSGTWLEASATNTADLVSMEYYANGDFIGAATNSPYRLWWGTSPQAQYILTAKATDREGKVTWSPPVHVIGGPPNGVWGLRRLPAGEMLFYYSVLPYAAGAHLAASDNPSSLGFYCSGGHTNIHLVEVSYPGVFVDESVRGGAVPRRFYAAIVRHDCP